MFSSEKQQNMDATHRNIFLKWCNFYNKFYYSFTKQKNTTNIDNDNIENLDQTKKKMLISIFIAFENFKKYCGDPNIYKDAELFQDLLSRKNEWFLKMDSI